MVSISLSRKRRLRRAAAKLRTRRRRSLRQGRSRSQSFSVLLHRRKQRGGADEPEREYPDATVVSKPDTGKYDDPDAVPTLKSAYNP